MTAVVDGRSHHAPKCREVIRCARYTTTEHAVGGGGVAWVGVELVGPEAVFSICLDSSRPSLAQ